MVEKLQREKRIPDEPRGERRKKNMTQRYLVAWAFPKKPGGIFYRVLRDEFAAPQPNGDITLIQRSVAICKDDFIASRVAALAEYFGAKVNCFEVKQEGINGQAQEEANAFVDHILHQRRHRQGRRLGS